jgi:menaquinol-cytochrome c reductase iron-sulfur subunit
VSWPAVAAGVIITIIFGFLWIREATREYRGVPAHESAPAAPSGPAWHVGEVDAEPEVYEEEPERFPRNVFLELSTLGLGAVIGAIVTVPVLGFMVLPSFVDQHYDDVNIGPMDNFPEGQFMVTTFLRDPTKGEVTRRTAYIRYNGVSEDEPSFTIISNRCAHLGCPVQPNGIINEDAKKQVPVKTPEGPSQVLLTPVEPSGFGCPCHGGQYDTEGNRTAGPPVRALDRYEFSIVNGSLVLGKPFSVAEVDGQGADATIHAYRLTGPGQHVDGIEKWLYPIQPPGR